MPAAPDDADMVTRTGGCHCGRVRFEVTSPKDLRVTYCNCSVCAKVGFLHLIVPKSRFKLLSGEAQLTSYQFNTRTAQHLFCSTCGVKSFYVPRSHPDGFSVNARCLDDVDIESLPIASFDGKHWEAQFSGGRSAVLDD
jgi:hypothetical protein